jgi:hypothetical protein
MEATPRLEEQKRADTICAVLKHPLRVRILEILNEGPRSPSQFVEEGLVPKEHYTAYNQALTLAAYHFRELEKAGCVQIIDTIPRRGALEHVYEGKARVYFTDTEFEEMEPARREQLSRISFQGLVARADGAMRAGTFDARTDRYLVWVPMQLDERGWDDLSAALTRCYGEVEQIRHDAKDRLAASGEESIPVTFGVLGFESPPPPPLPKPE